MRSAGESREEQASEDVPEPGRAEKVKRPEDGHPEDGHPEDGRGSPRRALCVSDTTILATELRTQAG